MHPQRTVIRPFALRQFLISITRHIVARTLPLVAFLTEMGGGPTKPLGDVTAEPAFEFDELLPVFLTFFDGHYITAVGTDQVRWVELTVVLSLVAVLESSEIRLFALEAHVIGVDGQGIL